MDILGSLLASVGGEITKGILGADEVKASDEREVVKKIKSGIGKFYDAYEKNIEKPTRDEEPFTTDDVTDFFYEQNDNLDKLLDVLYEYKTTVEHVFPAKKKEYEKSIGNLREIQESIAESKRNDTGIDSKDIVRRYEDNLDALYSVFKEIVDADAINI